MCIRDRHRYVINIKYERISRCSWREFKGLWKKIWIILFLMWLISKHLLHSAFCLPSRKLTDQWRGSCSYIMMFSIKNLTELLYQLSCCKSHKFLIFHMPFPAYQCRLNYYVTNLHIPMPQHMHCSKFVNFIVRPYIIMT